MMSLEEIWNRIDEANSIADIELRRKLIDNSIRDLEQFIRLGQVDAWYPIGYAYYCHPDRRDANSNIATETIKALENAIRNGVEVSLSHLYLAFHFFDCKEFEQAKSHIDSIAHDQLDETMAIRLRELSLCVSIRTLGLRESIGEIEAYAKFIDSLEIPAIPPIVLMNTIEQELRSVSISSSIRKALYCLDQVHPVLGENGFSRLLAENV